MEDCLKDGNIWMCKNRLKMNNGKTEYIYILAPDKCYHFVKEKK